MNGLSPVKRSRPYPIMDQSPTQMQPLIDLEGLLQEGEGSPCLPSMLQSKLHGSIHLAGESKGSFKRAFLVVASHSSKASRKIPATLLTLPAFPSLVNPSAPSQVWRGIQTPWFEVYSEGRPHFQQGSVLVFLTPSNKIHPKWTGFKRSVFQIPADPLPLKRYPWRRATARKARRKTALRPFRLPRSRARFRRSEAHGMMGFVKQGLVAEVTRASISRAIKRLCQIRRCEFVEASVGPDRWTCVCVCFLFC